jgi:RNA polymerase sigma factor FliA
MDYDKESLILSHMNLAKTIANREWRTATHALKLDDMLSLAFEGLVDAANRWETYCVNNKYDPSATQYFKVYASLRIRGTIRDYIRKDQRWATRTLRSKAKKLKEAGQDEGLSIEALASKTGMSVSDIHKVNAKLALKPISLDAHLTNIYDTVNGSSHVNDSFLRDSIDTESSVLSGNLVQVFLQTLRELPQELMLIVILRYYAKLDLKQVAERLDMPESKVSQLHLSALSTIQKSITSAAQEV